MIQGLCGMWISVSARVQSVLVVAILLKERRDLLQWKIEHPDAVNV